MKAKNISLNTLIYVVYADEIAAIKPSSVSVINGGIIRVSFYCRDSVDAKPDDEQIGKYYLNFSDAKRKQKEIRQHRIEDAYNNMQDSINTYNEMVKMYFDKPLTSDSEVKIRKY